MSAQPVGYTITFTISAPAVVSKKNNYRWLKYGTRMKVTPSAKVIASERVIASAARLAIARNGGRSTMPFDGQDTIRIDYQHDIDNDMLHVRVTKIGLLPERTPSGRVKGGKKLGTKRDCHGMLETIADALQGVAYPNDNQLDAGSWERLR